MCISCKQGARVSKLKSPMLLFASRRHSSSHSDSCLCPVHTRRWILLTCPWTWCTTTSLKAWPQMHAKIAEMRASRDREGLQALLQKLQVRSTCFVCAVSVRSEVYTFAFCALPVATTCSRSWWLEWLAERLICCHKNVHVLATPFRRIISDIFYAFVLESAGALWRHIQIFSNIFVHFLILTIFQSLTTQTYSLQVFLLNKTPFWSFPSFSVRLWFTRTCRCLVASILNPTVILCFFKVFLLKFFGDLDTQHHETTMLKS